MSKIITYIDALKNGGVKFETGLKYSEVSEIESRYKILFPPDYKEFIMTLLPISKPFVNWRTDSNEITKRLGWPLEGILFDVEASNYWNKEWGSKPVDLNQAKELVSELVMRAPKMIPIYLHRYIPEIPSKIGNPIFSIHQTDIIYYGTNLFDYFENEFHKIFGRSGYKLNGKIREIEFWKKLVI